MVYCPDPNVLGVFRKIANGSLNDHGKALKVTFFSRWNASRGLDGYLERLLSNLRRLGSRRELVQSNNTCENDLLI